MVADHPDRMPPSEPPALEEKTFILMLENGIVIDANLSAPTVLKTHNGQPVPLAAATDYELTLIAALMIHAMQAAAERYRAQSKIPYARN